ncbi:hypothetical protein [Gordoniibacillus kamchatkensis]|uniref:hypothetical protein n=1 Tax=Gordoniibacillus kamchatkensis TaxID=1590651 RepID=UPI0006985EFE|nr:hypothetical protein [Paenibacillus sp. VKM B-2647]
MFEKTHREWLEHHIRNRSGERRRRLENGHQHAEREMLRHVWWPAFGHFDCLHPEYEVTDFGEGARFIDFAYIRSGIKVAIEVDGYVATSVLRPMGAANAFAQ